MKCKHKHINPDYYYSFPCETPYCSGHEVYCHDCHRYIVECQCGYNNGESGWPLKRWRKHWRKKCNG